MKLEIGKVDVARVPAISNFPLHNRQVMIAFAATWRRQIDEINQNMRRNSLWLLNFQFQHDEGFNKTEPRLLRFNVEDVNAKDGNLISANAAQGNRETLQVGNSKDVCRSKAIRIHIMLLTFAPTFFSISSNLSQGSIEKDLKFKRTRFPSQQQRWKKNSVSGTAALRANSLSKQLSWKEVKSPVRLYCRRNSS